MTRETTADAPAELRRPGVARLLVLLLCAALLTSDGWLIGRGAARMIAIGGCGDGQERACESADLWAGLSVPLGVILGTVLLVGTAFALAADGSTSASSDLPIGAGTLLGLLCLLVGVALGADTTSGWLLGPAALVAVGAISSAPVEARRRRGILAEERQRAERAERLDRHGVTVQGTVVDLRGTGVVLNDCPELVVTVRYSTADGVERTEAFTKTFPVYDVPRRGDRLALRYDPRSPERPEPLPRTATPDGAADSVPG
ncbi:DUF3592 domain-containing protein [Kitasatospora sp. NPDC091207]|uniref:DUF3592 domain-containing protein n=1 Tax=Kitasatospora sp. NPDC091207 TaxID=3364083 RepID=UPI0037FECB16